MLVFEFDKASLRENYIAASVRSGLIFVFALGAFLWVSFAINRSNQDLILGCVALVGVESIVAIYLKVIFGRERVLTISDTGLLTLTGLGFWGKKTEKDCHDISKVRNLKRGKIDYLWIHFKGGPKILFASSNFSEDLALKSIQDYVEKFGTSL